MAETQQSNDTSIRDDANLGIFAIILILLWAMLFGWRWIGVQTLLLAGLITYEQVVWLDNALLTYVYWALLLTTLLFAIHRWVMHFKQVRQRSTKE